MKAVVMAGGEGKRLRPLTCAVPKPMVPILDKPMLEYALEHLLNHGIKEAALTLGYLPSVITDYFDKHRPQGMELTYYIEDQPLGTAGSVKNAQNFIDGRFVILSGDALTDIDLKHAVSAHAQSGAKATIVLKRMGNPQGLGVVITAPDGTVKRFVEKPGWEDVFSDAVNTGLYILEPEVIDLIPKGQKFDFAKDVFPLMMKKGMRIHGHLADGYWCDVGSVESYIRSHEDLLAGKVKARIKGQNIAGIFAGDGVLLSDSALLKPPVFLGAGAHIGDGAKIGQYSCIGAGARVCAHASVKRSVVNSGARVGRRANLSGCVVASGSAAGEGCSIFEAAVVGERCALGKSSRVAPHVRIWPEKSIGYGASANENIIFGHGEHTGLITSSGFVGDLGVDLTTLRLSRLLGAVAEFISGKSVAVCTDGSAVCSAAGKMAAGIFTFSGADVFSMQSVPRPVLALVSCVMDAELCVALHAHSQMLYADIFEPGLFMLGKAARRGIEDCYFCQGEKLADKECGKDTQVGAAEQFYINAITQKTDWSRTTAAHTRVVFSGMRSVDTLLARILISCGIKPVHTKGAAMQEALRDEGADFGVCMAKDGTILSLITPKGRRLSADECRLVLYYLLFNSLNKQNIKLPSNSLRGATALADIYGISYDFTSEEEARKDLSSDQRRLLHDGFFGVCRLAEHIARTGATLDELAALISLPHIKVKAIGCDYEDIGRLIGSVYAMGGACANEGLRLEIKGGSSYICPHASRPMIMIRTEADTEEFAAELCDIYTGIVRSILNKPRQGNPLK